MVVETTQGTIVVVGPDGVTRTRTFGAADGALPDLGPDVGELVEKALEGAGAGLPAADRARLKRALDPQGGAPQPRPGVPLSRDALDAIAGKLDRILERLEQLEHDVATLRAPQGSG